MNDPGRFDFFDEPLPDKRQSQKQSGIPAMRALVLPVSEAGIS
jgi:hypothetical protein